VNQRSEYWPKSIARAYMIAVIVTTLHCSIGFALCFVPQSAITGLEFGMVLALTINFCTLSAVISSISGVALCFGFSLFFNHTPEMIVRCTIFATILAFAVLVFFPAVVAS
jgi:ethanolamine transporter EutH